MNLIDTLKADLNNPVNPEKQYSAIRRLATLWNDKPRAAGILMAAALRAEDSRLKDEALMSLKKLAPDYALKRLIEATGDHNPNQQRRNAHYHLGSLGNSSAISIVMKGLHDQAESVRWAAVVSCGKLGNDFTVVRELQNMLSRERKESMIKTIHKSLEQIFRRLNSDRSFNGPGSNGSNERSSFNKQDPVQSFERSEKEKRKRPGSKFLTKSYIPKAF